jgi:hypothetical protein
MGKADIDGDAAALFFLQTIGIDAGERLDQGSFTVVNVTGGAYDHGLHEQQYSRCNRVGFGGSAHGDEGRSFDCVPGSRWKSGAEGGSRMHGQLLSHMRQ